MGALPIDPAVLWWATWKGGVVTDILPWNNLFMYNEALHVLKKEESKLLSSVPCLNCVNCLTCKEPSYERTHTLVLWTCKVLCGSFLCAIYKFSFIHSFITHTHTHAHALTHTHTRTLFFLKKIWWTSVLPLDLMRCCTFRRWRSLASLFLEANVQRLLLNCGKQLLT